jgi:predicted hydrocarbon binding protein
MDDLADGLKRTRRIEFPFHYSPDKKLVHIVAKISDEPGTLARLTTALGSRLNLVGTSSYKLGDNTAIFSGIAEVIDEVDDDRGIQKIAAETDGVIECKVWQSKNGLLVDQFHTGIESGLGEPYVMFSTAGLSQTFSNIVKVFGSGGETLLYLQGKDFAAARFSVYKELLGPNPWDRLSEAAHIYEALGYGMVTITPENGGRSLGISVRDCFECSGARSNGRSCSFMRGVAVGSISAVLGVEYKGEEVKCRLKGSRVCEFVLTPVTK